MDLKESKITLVKYIKSDDLDNFLSNFNHIKIDDLEQDFSLSNLKRDLFLDAIIDDVDCVKWIYIDVENLKITDSNKPQQRGTHKIVSINNFISKLKLERNFRLIFGYTNDRFEHGMIHRVNLSIDIKEGGEIIYNYSNYSVYNFKF